MGGVFSKSSRPLRPGAYFNWQAIQPATVQPAIGSVAAIAFTHVWGPLKTPVVLNTIGDFLNVFGGDPTNPSPGYIAVKQAFQGEGGTGLGGAGTVIAYRQGGSAVLAASHALQNTTPATALTLTALYSGTEGNNLNVTTQVNALDGTKTDLLVYTGTTLLETYTFLATDIVAAATAINAASAWITAAEAVTGVRLAYVTNVSLTGGNDGTTLVSGDYTSAMTDLGKQRFGVLAFQNLTDGSIVTSLLTWSQGLNSKGKRFTTIFGGSTDETTATAITSAGTVNDPNFIRLGAGHVVDANLLDVNGNAIALSTAQLAPRLAGVLAARGERLSMTFAKLDGLTLYTGASDSEIDLALAGGVMVLSQASADIPVRLESARTTFTTTTDTTRPYVIFRNPKAVATMQGIETELTEWGEANVVGQPVDGETRAAVLGQIGIVMTRRVTQRIVQSGWTAIVDPVPPPADTDEFVAFQIAFKYARSAEQIYFSGQIG